MCVVLLNEWSGEVCVCILWFDSGVCGTYTCGGCSKVGWVCHMLFGEIYTEQWWFWFSGMYLCVSYLFELELLLLKSVMHIVVEELKRYIINHDMTK